MAELNFQGWKDWKGGIDAGQYFSIGVDPYRKPGYLAVADSVSKSVSEDDIAGFTEAIYWFESVSGDLFAIDLGGDIWKRDSATGWENNATWPHNDGNAGSGQGLIEYNAELFWAANTTVGRIQTPTGTPTFTDSWQTGLTSASWHPMVKHVGKLMVGHGRNIATWDGTTWTATALTLPLGYVTKSGAVIGDYAAFGCVAPAGEDARIFLWDGTSSTYNAEIQVKAASVDALFTSNNILWAVAGRAANLHYYDGSNLKEVASIKEVDLPSGESVTVRPGGITDYRGKILLAVNTISTMRDRVMPGIWSFDPTNGAFVLAHLNSNKSMNTSAHAYSVYSDGTDFWVGGSDTNTGATSTTFVDKSGGSKYTEGCYWTSPWLDTNVFANKHFRKVYLNFLEFPASGTNEITVKYRVDDTTRRLNNGNEYTATGGGSDTVIIASTSGLRVGDEITVTGGPSSGDIRRITAVDGDGVSLTVDRAWTATPVNAQTKFVVERWVEVGTVTTSANANEVDEPFDLLHPVGKKIQFKIEMRDGETAGEEVAISDINVSYIQKKAV